MSDLDTFVSRHRSDPEQVRRWIVEAMVLGAVADGEIDLRETEAIANAVETNAAFMGMDATELRNVLERALSGVVMDGLPARVHALAGGLPSYGNRVLAFRCATRVAFADGSLANTEIDFLRELQRVLGITEADVARSFEDAQDVGQMQPIPAELDPVDTWLDCLLMAAVADKQLHDEEIATIIAFVISRDEFSGIPEHLLHQSIDARLRDFVDGGIPDRLEQLSQELLDEDARLDAWGLALAISLIDGPLVPAEERFLRALQEALDLEDDEIERLQRRLLNS